MREAGGESEKFSSCVDDGLVVSQVRNFTRMIMTFLMILFVCSFECLFVCLWHMFVYLFVFTYVAMFSSCVDDNLVVSQVGNFIRTTLMITVSLIFFLVVCFIYMSFLIVCFYICRIVFFMMMTIVRMTVAIDGNKDKS